MDPRASWNILWVISPAAMKIPINSNFGFGLIFNRAASGFIHIQNSHRSWYPIKEDYLLPSHLLAQNIYIF